MPKLLPLLIATALTACAAGPDYVRPATPEPEAFARAEAGTYSAESVEVGFWRGFEDPLLARLVDEGLAHNQDLRAALARYDQARAGLRLARADRFPTVTAGAEAASARHSADQLPGVARTDRDVDSYAAHVSAAWELDFFGRVRRSVEAARASAEAGAADLATLRVAVVGELAAAYFELRGLQAQLAVAQGNADNQADSLALVLAREEAGRGSALDTARARAQLELTRARLPALEAAVAERIHRIAVLAGREPQALIGELAAPAALPALPARVAVGAPGDLLRRRPDVRAAERRLAAATARIGVASADLFPRLTLGGLIGSQAVSTGELFARDSETRLLALGIDWSFLDVGRVRARIAAAEAGAEAGLAEYQQAVLRALEEAETALVRYARAHDERAHLAEAAAAAREAAGLARTRFDAGAADFLQVLDAERVRLEAEDQLAQADTRLAVGLVAVHRALAGAWPERITAQGELAAR